MVRRPLFFCLICYFLAYGIESLSNKSIIWMIVLLFGLLFCLIKKRETFLFLYLICFLFGHLGYERTHTLSPIENEIEGKEKALIYGSVCKVEQTEFGQTITIKKGKISLIKQPEIFYNSNKIIVYTDSSFLISIGNKLSILGNIELFSKACNQGQFNSYLYYKSKGIDLKCKADSIQVQSQSTNRIAQGLSFIQNQLSKVYDRGLNQGQAGIIKSMVLGDKTSLDQEIKERYQRCGISHILAISGLHISFIGMIFYQLLKKLGIGEKGSIPFTIIVLIAYGQMTGFSISTSRAVMMFSISLFAKLIGRTYDLLSAASICMLCFLIINPFLFYQSGFLLSFGAVFAIGIFFPLLKEIGKQYFSGFLVSSLIFIVTLPILLYYYFEISLYSILLNLIVIPIMSLLMPLSVLSGLIGIKSIGIGRFLMGSISLLLSFIDFLCNIVERLPYSIIIVGQPTTIQIIGYGTALFLFWQILLREQKKQQKEKLICFKEKETAVLFRTKKDDFLLLEKQKATNRRWRKRIVFLGMWANVILLIESIPLRLKENRFFSVISQEVKLTCLDIGQGDSMIIEFPNGTVCLIDSGSSNIERAGEYRLEPALKAKGVRTLDYVFVTHSDFDHYSAILELLQKNNKKSGTIFIKHLILPLVLQKDSGYEQLEQQAKEVGTNIHYIKEGDYKKEGEVILQCLYPKKEGSRESGNNSSIVLAMQYHNFAALFTGDIEKEVEEEITEQLSKTITFLKVAHHGSKTSSTQQFIETTKPVISVISCAEHNLYGHPSDEVIKRLEQVNSNIYITAFDHMITIKTDGKKVKVTTWKDTN